MKLLIAIPALDEEDSIADVIERALAVRRRMVREWIVSAVEITVVSDGSTDRTAERARAFGDQINLIVFDRNRGYGAAIKEAWRRSDADLLGFIDADRTCDPEDFAALSRRAIAENADIVLGCRLNPDSRMPAIRRLGNHLFATLLSLLAGRRIRDTATGLRVVRRSVLPRLMPLPDGLDFTPAMSARGMLDREVKLIESDVFYGVRRGNSKLQLTRDGLRFLRVIADAGLLYCPSRSLGFVGAALTAMAGIWVSLGSLLFSDPSSEWLLQVPLSTLLLGATVSICAAFWLARVPAEEINLRQTRTPSVAVTGSVALLAVLFGFAQEGVFAAVLIYAVGRIVDYAGNLSDIQLAVLEAERKNPQDWSGSA